MSRQFNRESISNKWCWEKQISTCLRTQHIKINAKWFKTPNFLRGNNDFYYLLRSLLTKTYVIQMLKKDTASETKGMYTPQTKQTK